MWNRRNVAALSSVSMDAAALRELGESGLVELLRRRPDLLAPPAPESLADLAERLTMPAGVVGALRRQDRPALQVAEAIAALGGRAPRATLDHLLGVAGPAARPASVPAAGPATEPAIGPVTGLAAGPDAVDRALSRLREHGLLLPGPDPALVDAARLAWPHPLGLG